MLDTVRYRHISGITGDPYCASPNPAPAECHIPPGRSVYLAQGQHVSALRHGSEARRDPFDVRGGVSLWRVRKNAVQRTPMREGMGLWDNCPLVAW
jgi:hypothetical protein